MKLRIKRRYDGKFYVEYSYTGEWGTWSSYWLNFLTLGDSGYCALEEAEKQFILAQKHILAERSKPPLPPSKNRVYRQEEI